MKHRAWACDLPPEKGCQQNGDSLLMVDSTQGYGWCEVV